MFGGVEGRRCYSSSGVAGITLSARRAATAGHLPLQESQVRRGASAGLGEGHLLPPCELAILALLVWDGCRQGALVVACHIV